MNVPLIVVGFVILVVGALINFSSSFIVKRFVNLDKITIDPHYNFSEEEKEEFINTQAVLRVKKLALIILFLGVLLILIATN